MSGETEERPSGWTIDTLAVYFQRQHDDLITLLNERHQAQQEAIRKAETAAERRLDSVNEFRAQLADQTASFVTRAEYSARSEALFARIDNVEKQLDQTSGRTAGVRLSAGTLIGAVSGLAAFITIVVVLANVFTGG